MDFFQLSLHCSTQIVSHLTNMIRIHKEYVGLNNNNNDNNRRVAFWCISLM